jgi:nucleoid DNA-binding protein
VTKKEIVRQISEQLGLTQLKTKEIVQLTFDAIVKTLLEDPSHRIELRNFGVFEVKRRKRRKARNPRTGARVEVPPKNVVTFKPGKEMEEKVRELTDIAEIEDEETLDAEASTDADADADTDTDGDDDTPELPELSEPTPAVEANGTGNGVADEDGPGPTGKSKRRRKKSPS